MAANANLLPSDHENGLQKMRGVAKFQRKNRNGTYQAQMQLSPSDELAYAIEAAISNYIGQESATPAILASDTDSVSRTWTLRCNKIKKDTYALVTIGRIIDVEQVTGSVTEEMSDYVFGGCSVQLGGALNNGAGIFGVSAVTVSSYEGLNAGAHAISTTYEVGAYVVPSPGNDHWYMAIAITTGTSAGVAPTFPTNGGTVVDGGVTWRDMGLIEYVAGSDYELSAEYGVLNIPSTGAIAVAAARVPSSLRSQGYTFRLSTDYTRSAKSYTQVVSDSSSGVIEGRFWFYSTNSKSDDQVWYAPYVTLVPTGDFALKSGTDYGSASFTVTAIKLPTLEDLYINNKPAP